MRLRSHRVKSVNRKSVNRNETEIQLGKIEIPTPETERRKKLKIKRRLTRAETSNSARENQYGFQETNNDNAVAQEHEHQHAVVYEPVNEFQEFHDAIEGDEAQSARKMGEYTRKPDRLQIEGNLAENWRKFKRNFDIYMSANELNLKSDAVKVNVFLNIIGHDAVEIYDTFKLTELQQTHYVSVIRAFDDFCKPKTNPVYERFVFWQRQQKEGESFDVFHVDIKRLVKNCGFGENEKEMLRDRIVIGIANKNLQKRLLETADLTYDKAVEKCKANEATQGHVDEMSKSTATVHELKRDNGNSNKNSGGVQARNAYDRKPQWNGRQHNGNERQQKNWHQQQQQNTKMSNRFDKEEQTCKFCNYKHKFGSGFCPAYGKQCSICKKNNHFQSVCRVKNVQAINSVDFDSTSKLYIDSLTQLAECSANATNIKSKPIWREDLRVKNECIAFKVDTGSDVTVLPKRLLAAVAPDCALSESKTLLRAFGGALVRPIGVCVLPCFLNGKKKFIEIEIVDFETVPLLGLTACIQFDLVDVRKMTQRRVNFLGV